MLYRLYKDKIDKDILKKAIERTSKHRDSFETVLKYREISNLFRKSEMPKTLWRKYIQNNPYAKGIDFTDAILIYEEIGTVLDVNDNGRECRI